MGRRPRGFALRHPQVNARGYFSACDGFLQQPVVAKDQHLREDVIVKQSPAKEARQSQKWDEVFSVKLLKMTAT